MGNNSKVVELQGLEWMQHAYRIARQNSVHDNGKKCGKIGQMTKCGKLGQKRI